MAKIDQMTKVIVSKCVKEMGILVFGGRSVLISYEGIKEYIKEQKRGIGQDQLSLVLNLHLEG